MNSARLRTAQNKRKSKRLVPKSKKQRIKSLILKDRETELYLKEMGRKHIPTNTYTL